MCSTPKACNLLNQLEGRAAPAVAGPIVQVILNGQGRLFLPGRESSYLYTP